MIELYSLLFLCMLLGRRCNSLLPDTIQQAIGFYVAPILGLSLLILIVTVYGWLLPFHTGYSVTIAVVITLTTWWFENNKRQLWIDCLQVFVFASLVTLPLFAPVLRFGGYNPFTDIFTYLAQGQWLQTHAFSETAVASGYHPTLTQIVIYQGPGSRMGGSFLLGYVQSLFHMQWSYYAYLPALSLAFVSGCLAVGATIRQVVAVNRIVGLALATMPCFLVNGFVFGAEWGFYPQTFGLAFAAGLSALFPSAITHMLENNYSWTKIAQYILPAAISMAALLFAYNEPFPIFVVALALFFILALLCYHKTPFKDKLKTLVLAFVLFTLEVLLLINYEAIRIIRNLLQTLGVAQGQAAIGWAVPWSPLQFLAYAFGFKTPFNSDRINFDYLMSTWFFPLLFIALCIFLVSMLRKDNKSRLSVLFLIVVDGMFLLAFLKFRYFSPSISTSEVGHTFLQFKVAKYASLFSISLLGIFFASVWQLHEQRRKQFAYVFLSMMIVGMMFHVIKVTNAFHRHFINEVQNGRKPFDGLLQLREALADIPPEQVVHVALGEQHSKLRQMIAYILYDRKISSDYRDDGYLLGSLPENERNMSPQRASYMITMKNANNNLHFKHARVVGPFVVLQAPFDFFVLERSEGGYNAEGNDQGDTWNWVNNNINYYYNNYATPQKVKFAFSLTGKTYPRNFLIQLKDHEGTIVAEYTLATPLQETEFISPWINTQSKRLVLHVEADGDAMRLSRLDSRMARFMISNVTLKTG